VNIITETTPLPLGIKFLFYWIPGETPEECLENAEKSAKTLGTVWYKPKKDYRASQALLFVEV